MSEYKWHYAAVGSPRCARHRQCVHMRYAPLNGCWSASNYSACDRSSELEHNMSKFKTRLDEKCLLVGLLKQKENKLREHHHIMVVESTIPDSELDTRPWQQEELDAIKAVRTHRHPSPSVALTQKMKKNETTFSLLGVFFTTATILAQERPC